MKLCLCVCVDEYVCGGLGGLGLSLICYSALFPAWRAEKLGLWGYARINRMALLVYNIRWELDWYANCFEPKTTRVFKTISIMFCVPGHHPEHTGLHYRLFWSGCTTRVIEWFFLLLVGLLQQYKNPTACVRERSPILSIYFPLFTQLL